MLHPQETGIQSGIFKNTGKVNCQAPALVDNISPVVPIKIARKKINKSFSWKFILITKTDKIIRATVNSALFGNKNRILQTNAIPIKPNVKNLLVSVKFGIH